MAFRCQICHLEWFFRSKNLCSATRKSIFGFKGVKIRCISFKKLYMNLFRLQRVGIEKLMLNCAIKYFQKSDNNATIYVKTLYNDDSLIIYLYVDDFLVTGSDEQELQKFKVNMEKQCELSNLKEMKYFGGWKYTNQSLKFFSINTSMIWRFWKTLECKIVNQFLHNWFWIQNFQKKKMEQTNVMLHYIEVWLKVSCTWQLQDLI